MAPAQGGRAEIEKCKSVNDKARESANQLDTQLEKCKSVND